VAIAGIIAMRPNCIVLDEPTAMLDPQGRDEVIKTIKNLNEKFNITVILITHFMEEALLAGRIILMNQGKVALDMRTSQVFEHTNLLEKCNISMPLFIQLIQKLRAKGFDLPCDISTEQACINALDEEAGKRK
jgi:energy-coupling factor transport system ATP-binding protein